MDEAMIRGAIGSLARGLREQLQTMTAAVYALAPKLSGDEAAADYLAVIRRAICGALRLTQQAELGERVFDNSEVRVVLAPMDLAELGRSVMERVDALTRPLLDIKAEFSSPLVSLPTCADRSALEQMLLYLITNSVQAMDRPGTVRLELEQAGDRAVFTVTDTGRGLDPGSLAGLLDPEEEMDAPFRGLLVARQIALAHSGTLVAGNTEAGGARLAVSIPIVESVGGAIRSPGIPVEAGGWDPALVALSGCLPLEAFPPDRGRP